MDCKDTILDVLRLFNSEYVLESHYPFSKHLKLHKFFKKDEQNTTIKHGILLEIINNNLFIDAKVNSITSIINNEYVYDLNSGSEVSGRFYIYSIGYWKLKYLYNSIIK